MSLSSQSFLEIFIVMFETYFAISPFKRDLPQKLKLVVSAAFNI